MGAARSKSALRFISRLAAPSPFEASAAGA
jgi:hypothetical protein